MGADGISLGRIERRRAVDDVYQAIREAILDRRFPPRMRLNVEELALQLGVSLTPVRSAIQLLAAEGLVDVHSRSGTFVATISRRELEETSTSAARSNAWLPKKPSSPTKISNAPASSST